jgi:hypothetical protein
MNMKEYLLEILHKRFWSGVWVLTHNGRKLVRQNSVVQHVPGDRKKSDLSLFTFSSLLFSALTATLGLEDNAKTEGFKNISSGIAMCAPVSWRSEKEA